jgi:hypothetical protein
MILFPIMALKASVIANATFLGTGVRLRVLRHMFSSTV